MKTRVLLYDDNAALRQSMEVMLSDEPEIEFLAGISNAETADIDIRELKPDVILMDIDMPELNGIIAVQQIRKKFPELPIIMLTVFDDNDNIFKAVCAGASGYILKRYAANEILAAINDVMSGGAPMTGSVAKKVLKMLPLAKTKTEELTNLTKKETQILQYMVQGYSYKMIASELNNSVDTIRYHIKNIYAKLHVHSAAQAVIKAMNSKF